MRGGTGQAMRPPRCATGVIACVGFGWALACGGLQADARLPPGSSSAPPRIVGDSIPEPLSQAPGDAQRGRAVVADRTLGLCLLCHTAPIAEERFQGNIAPDLRGAGSRWSEGQLRLRLVDPQRLNPGSVMPAYHVWQPGQRTRVGAQWQGKPVLSAQQIEDVVAYLGTLRESRD
jgi:L-cysteine S-thiosulfotransferase